MRQIYFLSYNSEYIKFIAYSGKNVRFLDPIPFYEEPLEIMALKTAAVAGVEALSVFEDNREVFPILLKDRKLLFPKEYDTVFPDDVFVKTGERGNYYTVELKGYEGKALDYLESEFVTDDIFLERYKSFDPKFLDGDYEFSKELIALVANDLLEDLQSYENETMLDVSELPWEMYNSDFRIIGTAECLEFCSHYAEDVFLSLEREKDELGEIIDVNLERVVTLTFLYAAMELMSKIESEVGSYPTAGEMKDLFFTKEEENEG